MRHKKAKINKIAMAGLVIELAIILAFCWYPISKMGV
jgi:hypothetical protein